MNELDKELISEVSTEKSIDKAYIEKDYYVVQVLRKLLSFLDKDIHIEFSGGTSLSKGFDIIKRFSEDIDFMLQVPEAWNRTNLKKFRNNLKDSINSMDELSVDEENVTVRDSGKFFSFYVNYPQSYEKASLRPQVKLEVSVKPIKCNPISCQITSWVEDYLGENNPVNINCVDPMETAANKFSALLWRINNKDRTSDDPPKNDPTMIRHIYDLYMLREIIDKDTVEFYKLVDANYEYDKKRGNSNDELTLKNFALSSLNKIKNDELYKKEYNEFVDEMIYNDLYKVPYDLSLQHFEKLINNISKE